MRFGQHWLEDIAERVQRISQLGPAHREAFFANIERELRWKFREEWEDEAARRRSEELSAMWEWACRCIGPAPGRVEVDTAGDTFVCYASAFNRETDDGFIYAPGAFKAVIPGFLERGRVMADHRIDRPPIGRPVEAHEDGEGLIVRGLWAAGPAAQECRAEVRRRLAAGEPAPCSIFAVVDLAKVGAEVRDGRRVRVVREVEELYEVSVCDRGKNPGARFLTA